MYSNIQNWILYTPTFQMITMLIASPLTLAVALWGMSGPFCCLIYISPVSETSMAQSYSFIRFARYGRGAIEELHDDAATCKK